MLYLASPYSHPDPAVREQRFIDVCKAAALLMQQGKIVFSPIAHSHPIAKHGLPSTTLDLDFWMKQDAAFVRMADELVVLMLPGWEQSRGVAREITIAEEADIPVHYLDPTADDAAELAGVA